MSVLKQKNRMHRMKVLLTDIQIAALRKIAQQTKRAVAAIIRECIDIYVVKQKVHAFVFDKHFGQQGFNVLG